MPATVRSALVGALAARYETLDVPTLRVERNRAAPVSEFPTLVVREGDQGQPSHSTGSDLYKLDLTVEGWVKAGTKAQALADADELYGLAHRAAMADPALGPGCADLYDTGLTVTTDTPATEAVAMFVLSLVLEFETVPGDPFTAATV